MGTGNDFLMNMITNIAEADTWSIFLFLIGACISVYVFMFLLPYLFRVKPKFKIGDKVRVIMINREEWEQDVGSVYIIRKVGKKSYQITPVNNDQWTDKLLFSAQHLYEKIGEENETASL